jgi:hypothetical protein
MGFGPCSTDLSVRIEVGRETAKTGRIIYRQPVQTTCLWLTKPEEQRLTICLADFVVIGTGLSDGYCSELRPMCTLDSLRRLRIDERKLQLSVKLTEKVSVRRRHYKPCQSKLEMLRL